MKAILSCLIGTTLGYWLVFFIKDGTYNAEVESNFIVILFGMAIASIIYVLRNKNN